MNVRVRDHTDIEVVDDKKNRNEKRRKEIKNHISVNKNDDNPKDRMYRYEFTLGH